MHAEAKIQTQSKVTHGYMRAARCNNLYFLPLSDFHIHQYIVRISTLGEAAKPVQDSANRLFLIS